MRCLCGQNSLASKGIQLTSDSSSFAAFSSALLSMIRDEYAKLPIMSIHLLSEVFQANLENSSNNVSHLNVSELCLRTEVPL